MGSPDEENPVDTEAGTEPDTEPSTEPGSEPGTEAVEGIGLAAGEEPIGGNPLNGFQDMTDEE